MQEIKITIFNTLPSELQKQTEDLRFAAFHKETLTPEKQAENDDKYLFENDAFRFVIALIKEVPVGYIRLFKRNITFRGKEILLGGIGGVCTDPKLQRKGIATRMLHVAIGELQKEQCDIAYLCTNIEKLEKLYGQIGFVTLNRPYTFVGKSGKRYTKSDGMIAPVNSKEIFKEVLKDTQPFDLQGMNW